MFIKKSISEEGTLGRGHSEIQVNHVFFYLSVMITAREKPSAIISSGMVQRLGRSEGGEDKLMFG